ncbi:Six-hairpin glycosidase-like protein [Syncephalis fuscata]|nr:Six-hairpin glycosidase-like protein [Syncephalis fuscata]
MIPRVWVPALYGVLAATLTFSPVPSNAAGTDRASFAKWSATQYSVSTDTIRRSMQPNGAIYASPSKNNPDYYYFWTRDGGLTMDALVSQLQTNPTTYENMFERFTSFTRLIQSTPNPSNSNPNADVSHLYKPDLQTPSPIKTDLEYVSHHWGETSFEIWEEVKGHHFYTRLVQYKAMKDGADVASKMNDPKAAAWYKQQANAIEKSLNDFWDSKRNLILTTIGRDAGLDYKASNIDNQVILASLHAGDESTGLFAPWDDRVLASAKVIIDTFKPLYKINTANPQLPPAIGRYPEDRYDGVGTTGGNPWVLCTASHAEILYRAYLQWARTGQVLVTSRNVNYLNYVLADSGVGKSVKVAAGQTLRKGNDNYTTLLNAMLVEGDRFLQRIQLHTPSDYNLTEQWNHDSGFAQGASQLTWSHTAFTTAIRAGQAARAIKV